MARLREACYQLFGYRVDMASQASKAANPPTVVTLKPRYAGQGAELIFQMGGRRAPGAAGVHIHSPERRGSAGCCVPWTVRPCFCEGAAAQHGKAQQHMLYCDQDIPSEKADPNTAMRKLFCYQMQLDPKLNLELHD